MYASHSPIHTHIHTPTAIGCHARYQPARQEQLGVWCLAQGHFDTPRVGSNRQPSDCQTTALPPELYRPLVSFSRRHPGWDQTCNPPTARRLLLPPEPFPPSRHNSSFDLQATDMSVLEEKHIRPQKLQSIKLNISNLPIKRP